MGGEEKRTCRAEKFDKGNQYYCTYFFWIEKKRPNLYSDVENKTKITIVIT